MDHRRLLGAALATLGAALLCAPVARAQDDGSITAGRRLAATHCGGCHAVDRSDQSPNPRAPRFRSFGRNFPFEGLREALREHMIIGHPEMPVVILTQPEAGDLIAYLKSLQTADRPQKSRQRAT